MKTNTLNNYTIEFDTQKSKFYEYDINFINIYYENTLIHSIKLSKESADNLYNKLAYLYSGYNTFENSMIEFNFPIYNSNCEQTTLYVYLMDDNIYKFIFEIKSINNEVRNIEMYIDEDRLRDNILFSIFFSFLLQYE